MMKSLYLLIEIVTSKNGMGNNCGKVSQCARVRSRNVRFRSWILRDRRTLVFISLIGARVICLFVSVTEFHLMRSVVVVVS